MNEFQPWGRYPKASHKQVIPLYWRTDIPQLNTLDSTVLPYGLGRSYGDVCLNPDNTLLHTIGLDKFISLNPQTGMLCCEAGVSLKTILDVFVPKGWFLPVTPGTKFVTVGGAIANDVHGKNHHCAGTFGNFVTEFELLRSDGQRFTCSAEENEQLYRATIGGLGLTGLITKATVKLKPVKSDRIEMESIKFYSIAEFLRLSEASQNDEYTVAWIDCSKGGKKAGRGLYMRGNHSVTETTNRHSASDKQIPFPFDAPGFLLNRWSIRLFNSLFFHKQLRKTEQKNVHYEPFFYPLDAIHNWNRMYGKQGFFQYQSVVPFKDGEQVIEAMLAEITTSGNASFLAVLKTFGDMPSPGMLSFPRPGITLALDFPNKGKKTLALLDRLDAIVKNANGVLYPAKDARMSAKMFEQSYPDWGQFREHIDPKFSSGFWQRVTSTKSYNKQSSNTTKPAKINESI